MSAIAVSPSATGTGTVTIAAPATNTNRTLTLPDAAGTVATTLDAIGVGQTWQNVKASRTTGTSYQNTTGSPIMVFITTDATADRLVQVSVDNTTWITLGTTAAVKVSHSFVVPNNWYYRINNSTTIVNWSELR